MKKYFYHSPYGQINPIRRNEYFKLGYRIKTVSRYPRVTVMGVISGDNFIFTVSRCSHKDNFSRWYGRESCENRLTSGNYYQVIPVSQIPTEPSEGKWFVERAKEIADEVLYNSRKLKRCS